MPRPAAAEHQYFSRPLVKPFPLANTLRLFGPIPRHDRTSSGATTADGHSLLGHTMTLIRTRAVPPVSFHVLMPAPREEPA